MELARCGLQLLTWLRARLHDQARREPPRRASGVRLVFVQYGDYESAYRRFQDPNGEETYYAQRYTVEFMAELAQSPGIEQITVVTFSRDEPLKELAPGLSSAGVELYPHQGSPRHAQLIELVAGLRPTHLIVGGPLVPIIRWALARKVPVLPLFADSFRGGDLRTQVRNARLAFVLNDPRIRYVANHNLAAAMELARIGVEETKVVPYDWPAVVTPADQLPKSAPPRERAFRLVYVGQVSELKGVGDLLHAVAQLRRERLDCTLTVIGASTDDALPRLASGLGIGEHVAFLGTRPHPEVRAAMREHDAVVVPSRHEYPEGLPMTLYEGLCSRSPLIVSDHPMFALRIRHDQNALVFRAGSPAALAARVRQLAESPALYERLSKNAEQAAEGYLCPLKWDRLITAWLDPARDGDIAPHRLAPRTRTRKSA